MISKEQAYNIARQIIPDLEIKGAKISDILTSSKLINILPPDCWYISYSSIPLINLSCSNGKKVFFCIDKIDGKILFHNTLE